ncbi:MAG: hypothetical protein AAB332_03720 [Planctomycetota bacterium]
MKWILSVALAMLVTLFCLDFAPVQKSLVYAQSTPTGQPDSYASVGEDESGDVSEQKGKKTVACDNYGYVWTMTIKGGKVTGTVQTTDCGTWKVTGTYKKKKLNVKATNQENNGCCEWFTYTGTFNKKTKVGSGTWANSSECGGTGSWTMSACK